MKKESPTTRPRIALLAAAVLLLVPGARSTAAQARIEYNVRENSTNAYRMQLESKSETNPVRYEGVVFVIVRPFDSNTAQVTLRGNLQFRPPQRPPGPPQFHPMAAHMHMLHHGPVWRIQPAIAPSECVIDSRGRPLRYPVTIDLPRPLENYLQVIFPTLPPVGETEWTSETIAMAEDEMPGGPPGGFGMRGPMGSGMARLPGLRQEKVRIEEISPTDVQIERHVQFQSRLQTGDEPRLSSSVKSRHEFDRAAGFLKNARLEGTVVYSTLDFIRKTPLTLSLERIEGDELDEAIAESGLAQAPPVSQAEFETLLAQLEGDERAVRLKAAERLIAADVDQHARVLLPLLLPMAGDPDPHIQRLLGQALASAGGQDHVPLMLRLVQGEDRGGHHHPFKAFSRIKDKRTIQPLADLVASGSHHSHAAAHALSEFGPAVEEAALELLKERHAETKRRACQILQQSGTSRSIGALQEIIATGDRNILNEASQAIREIRSRWDQGAGLLF